MKALYSLRPLIIVLFLLVAACPSHGAERIDLTFGVNGVALTDFGINDDRAHAVAVQEDGKILVAGFSDNGYDTDMAVARYNSDGTLDPDFNYSGQVSMAIGNDDDVAYALTIQNDGKIILAGSSFNGTNNDIALLRLTADGYPDLDFDGDGIVTIPVGKGDDTVYDVLVRKDGRILLAGVSKEENTQNAFVVRLKPNGLLDYDFGSGGIVQIDKEGSAAYTLAIQEDEKIICAGSSGDEEQTSLSLYRFYPSGSPDRSFGNDGVTTFTIAKGSSTAFDLALQSEDNKIIVAGFNHNGEYKESLLARFDSAGKLDKEFGQSGYVLSNLGYDSVAYEVAILADNTIMAAGYGSNGSDKDFSIIRYNPESGTTQDSADGEGTTSTSITINGLTVEDHLNQDQTTDSNSPQPYFTLTDINNSDDTGQAIAIQNDGRILTAGFSDNGRDTDFALVRFGGQNTQTASTTADGEGIQTGSIIITTATIKDENRFGATSGGEIIEIGSGQLDSDCLDDCKDNRSDCEDDKDTCNENCSDTKDSCYDNCDDATDCDERTDCELDCDITKNGCYAASLAAKQDCYIPCTDSNCISVCDDIEENENDLCDLEATECYSDCEDTIPCDLSSCEEECDTDEVDCGESCDEDYDTCYNDDYYDCYDSCLVTVDVRGVCYSIYPNPDLTGVLSGSTTDEEEVKSWATVTDGYTEDGSGPGEYKSYIEGVTPETFYYVRAYATLSNGDTIYGNELGFKTKDACFIATAAYGSIISDQVVYLRKFRDTYMKTNALGRKLVSLYYNISPPIAELIDQHEGLRFLVRLLLLPFIAISYLATQANIAIKLTTLFLFLSAIPFFLLLKNKRAGRLSGKS